MTPEPVSPLQPAPWGFPLLAAGSTLLGPVLGFILFILQLEKEPESEWGDSRPFASLLQAWAEGGWAMYAALGAAVVLAIITAVFVIVASRGSSVLAIVTPLFAVIPAAIGAAGTNSGLAGSIEAVLHASPADRALILCGSAKEALQSTTLGACLSAGACAALAAALLLGSRAQPTPSKATHRQALTLGGVLLGPLSVLALVGAIASHKVAAAYGVIVYFPGSPLEDVKALVDSFQQWQSFTAGAAFVAVLGAFVLSALLKAPGGGRAVFAAAALFSVMLLFISVRSKLSTSFQEAVSASSRLGERFKFDAPMTSEGAGPDVDETTEMDAELLASRLRTFVQLHAAANDFVDHTSLTLRPGATAGALQLALRTAVAEKLLTVTLLTDPTQPAPSTLPPPFSFATDTSHGLKLKLGFYDDACRDACELATLTDDALTVGKERWPLERSATTQDDGPPLYLIAEPHPPARLLSAIATAAKHQRSLTLLFGPEVSRIDSEWASDFGPEAPEEPQMKAELIKIDAMGSLTVAQVKPVLAAMMSDLGRCDREEDTTLPKTLHVEFVVSGGGDVGTLVAEGSYIGWCVRETIERLEFPAVEKVALALVRLDVKFTELPKKKVTDERKPGK